MKISINSNKPPVVTIGLSAPGMRLALGFPAENSGLFLMILILEVINDEVFTNDDDDINEVDDCVCASHQASASSSCQPCGTLRRTSWAKLVEAWGLVQLRSTNIRIETKVNWKERFDKRGEQIFKHSDLFLPTLVEAAEEVFQPSDFEAVIWFFVYSCHIMNWVFRLKYDFFYLGHTFCSVLRV